MIWLFIKAQSRSYYTSKIFCLMRHPFRFKSFYTFVSNVDFETSTLLYFLTAISQAWQDNRIQSLYAYQCVMQRSNSPALLSRFSIFDLKRNCLEEKYPDRKLYVIEMLYSPIICNEWIFHEPRIPKWVPTLISRFRRVILGGETSLHVTHGLPSKNVCYSSISNIPDRAKNQSDCRIHYRARLE